MDGTRVTSKTQSGGCGSYFKISKMGGWRGGEGARETLGAQSGGGESDLRSSKWRGRKGLQKLKVKGTRVT